MALVWVGMAVDIDLIWSGRNRNLRSRSTSFANRVSAMRLCRQAFAVASIFLAAPSSAAPYGGRLPQQVRNSQAIIAIASEDQRAEPDTDVLALPSGKCSTLKIAGRDFACRAVAFFQNEQGRANFVIALDDPADGSHIVTFSGDNGRREKDDLYELQIDRMLLNSKDRPKVDGLPVPVVRTIDRNMQAARKPDQDGNFQHRLQRDGSKRQEL